MEKVNIGIPSESRRRASNLMYKTLADEFVLYVKTLNYHWNVFGPQFNDLHKFFQTQYEELAEVVDDVAERVRAIGGRPIGNMSSFLQHTRLQEETSPNLNGKEMVQALLRDHENIIRHLRDDINECDEMDDLSSSDFLTGLMRQHEKFAWMLRALVEG